MVELSFKCYECDYTIEVLINPGELETHCNWSTRAAICMGCRLVHEVWFDGQTLALEPDRRGGRA